MIQNQNFIKLFFLFSGLLLFTYILFSIFIDPYGYWHSNSIKKINLLKPNVINHLSLNKQFQAKKIQPEVLILGSSTVLMGINPDLNLFNGKKTYNAGIGSFGPIEIYYFLKNNINHNSNIKEIFLGLDLFMFNEDRNLRKYYYNDSSILFEKIKLIFTKTYLRDSLTTITSNIFDSEFSYNLSSLGHLDPIPVKELMLISQKSQKGIILNGYRQFFLPLEIHTENNDKFPLYSISSREIQYLQKIVDLCRENNIELFIFLSPTHASFLQTLINFNLEDEIYEWKTSLRKIYNFHDFLNFNVLSTEVISEDMNTYIDLNHYTEIVGERIINEVKNNQYIISNENYDYNLNYKVRDDWKKKDIKGIQYMEIFLEEFND